ncbi:hypothetical protein HHX47_DHR9000281 [Lentinula edodes]|nr:hypothetical protein HHX47_DHR9000281 [Lentinula edodes]
MANIAIWFPSGELLLLPFYVTHLDSSCKAVLGYSFLSHYNPLIDWASRNITFRNTSHLDSPQTSVPSAINTVVAKVAVPLPKLLPSVSLTILETPPGDSLRSRSQTLRAKPLSSKFPFEPIYSYPTVSQFAAQLETPEVDIAPVRSPFFFVLSTQRSRPAPPTALPPLPSSIPAEYAEFADVFDEIAADSLPEHRPYSLKIDLEEGASLPLGRIYPLSEKELVALKDFIDKQLATGAINPSSSPHGAPVLFIPKKDGKLRLCVDFRGLNRITKKDRYPLPLISDLLDAPKRAKIYTKLDLAHAYHLVRIAEGDEWKTTFRTRYGSYKWKVMPFSLMNAPAAFQQFVNDIFSDMLDVCVIVYLDDILIYSDTPEEHREHVKEVLRCFRHHWLYANPEKCKFNMDTVEYLGYILSPDGLTMSKEKVQTVLEWPVPRKVKDIQSFVGFANFYHHFIYNYSDIVVPMTRLTRKGAPWIWDSSCQEAFENLKIAFTSAPILAHWEPNCPLIVETDNELASFLCERERKESNGHSNQPI